jgi:hypothetical protein
MTEKQERKIKDQARLFEILHFSDINPDTGGMPNEIYCKGCAFRTPNNSCYKVKETRWWYLFKKEKLIEMKKDALPDRACCVEKYIWGKK